MYHAYGVAATRELEAQAMARVGDDALMQRAAQGLSVHAARLLAEQNRVYGSRVLILVGSGNNGGDALFAGARLARRGCAVTAVRCLGRPHAAGLAALLGNRGRIVELAQADLSRVDLVIDGILGIGGRPGLPDDVAALARRLAEAEVPVIAVDLPSGVAADTGAVPGAVIRADLTVTFGSYKPCHVLQPAREQCGRIELVDIGLEPAGRDPAYAAWETSDVAAAWPVPGPQSDKYSRGVVGVDTGSAQYPGAGLMSTIGAAWSGAGMIRFQGPDEALGMITELLPNVVHGSGRVQSYLLGSGWGRPRDGRDRVEGAIASGLPVVVDADGLRYLPPRLRPTVLLTPHAGELARLLEIERTDVEADPGRAVRRAANRTGATVLLKGATQLVAGPGVDRVEVAVPGPAWTGQAGSGDTLGGICATLLASGLATRTAAVCAASLQAMTAASHPGPYPPQELARLFAAEISALTASRSRA